MRNVPKRFDAIGPLCEDDIDIMGLDLDALETDKNDEDPNFAGTIRSVPGAVLVYKRKDRSGTFEELWVYNSDHNIKTLTRIRKSILAGTDIDPHSEISEDGKQQCETVTVGNVQFLHITGLPN